jgi:hypothetical protein
MTSQAQSYRARAAQCEHMAERNRDPALKAQYLKMARQWRDLSDLAEQDEATSRRDGC